MGADWFALQGVLDQGGDSLGAFGDLGEGLVVICRATMPPWQPKQRLWYLGFIYLL